MRQVARFSLLVVAAFSIAVNAQSVISAHSGTVHYVEGKVLLNGTAVSPKFGEFPAMENGSVIETTDQGRVEVLMSPGVILRVGESSAVRMISNSVVDAQVELQSGKAVLECAEILKGNSVGLVVAGRTVTFEKNGLYEATTEPPAVYVYKGHALVADAGRPMLVKKGHEALLGTTLSTAKFDADQTDDLYNWSSRRSGYLALANVAAARAAGQGYGYSYAGGAWAWNPWLGMFTMLPSSGMLWSPFGWGFYSPYSVWGAYEPYYYGYGYGGYGSGGGTTTTYSGRPAIATGGANYGGNAVSAGRSGTFAPISTGGGDGGSRSVAGQSVGGGTSTGHGGHR